MCFVVPHHVVIPEAFADFVLARRWTILILVVASALLGVAIAVLTPIRTSITQGFMPDDVEFEEYRRKAQSFGGSADDVILLGTVEGDALFTPPTLDAIRAAARRMEKLPEVDRVGVFVDAPWLAPNRPLSLRGTVARVLLRRMILRGEAPGVEDLPARLYWPRSKARQQAVDLDALRQALMKFDPLAGAMISRDGASQVMIVRVADDAPKQGSAPARFAQRLEQIARQHGLGKGGVYSAGVLVTEGGMLREVQRSAWELGPLGAFLICLLVYAVFRRISLVGVTMMIALSAIAWSLGVTAITFGRITLLVAAAPLLITVISTSDTIHIASAYIAEIRGGLTREQAVRRTIADVGGACVLTSVTTFVGFLSLMVIPAATVRHFSLSISIGVASALLLALTICPITFSMIELRLQPTSLWGLSLVNSLIAQSVQICKRLSLRWPRSVTAFHVVVFAVSLYLMSTMTMDADLPDRFPQSHGVRRGVEFFNRKFDGSNNIELYFRADQETLTSPRFVQALTRLERRLLTEPAIRRAVSLATLVNATDSMLGIPQEEPLTSSRLHATLALLSKASPEGVDAVLSRQDSVARMTVQITLTRVFQIEKLARRAEAICREELPEGVQVEASGAYPILGAAAQTVIRAQYQGFAICFLSVMTLVGLGVRSLRLALLAAIPNLLPLTLLGGLLWLTTKVVDPDILGVAIVSFGLAVDDTIHFLHRYDIERTKSNDVLAALERTFDYTGLAIVRTTVILGVGLSAFSLSGYLSVWFMGTYMVFVLAGAVLGDLLLLPGADSVVRFPGQQRGLDSISGGAPPKNSLTAPLISDHVPQEVHFSPLHQKKLVQTRCSCV